MVRRGTNLPAVAGYNQALVLDLIRRERDGYSRVELAERTGLSAQTLSNVTRRLIDEGFVREAGKSGTGPGKPRTILQLDAEARFAVGVHLDPTVVTYVVLDLEGRVVADARARTPTGIEPEETLRRLTASISAIIDNSGVDPSLILGVGIASPGPLDAEQGRIFDPPLLEAWHDVPLGDSLSASTGLPVRVEKDVTAAMVAESWMGTPDDLHDALFFYYGTGVGSGVMIDGTVIRGSSSNAGDIGHLIVDPDGPLCRCGKRGCLGDSILPVTLVAEGVSRGILPERSGPVDAITIDGDLSRLAELALAGEPVALEIIERAARRVARGLLGVASLLDVTTVVFGGPVWERVSSIFLRVVPQAFADDPASMLTHTVEFRGSIHGGDVAAMGAACLVLDGAFSAKPTDLMIDG